MAHSTPLTASSAGTCTRVTLVKAVKTDKSVSNNSIMRSGPAAAGPSVLF